MKLSDRDLKLLVILLIAVVIACPILFVIRPYNTKIDDTQAHIDQLKERQSFLAKLNENRQFYNDSIVLLANERDLIISDYAEGLRDENTVMFLANTEKQIPIAMRALAFSESDSTEISEGSVDENGNYIEGLSARTSYSSVEYFVSYDNLKVFLQYIMDNPNRMVITSLTADQMEDGTISGTFRLNQYAVSGEGRELDSAKIPSMEHGVDNVFGEPEVLPEETEAEGEAETETN